MNFLLRISSPFCRTALLALVTITVTSCATVEPLNLPAIRPEDVKEQQEECMSSYSKCEERRLFVEKNGKLPPLDPDASFIQARTSNDRLKWYTGNLECETRTTRVGAPAGTVELYCFSLIGVEPPLEIK